MATVRFGWSAERFWGTTLRETMMLANEWETRNRTMAKLTGSMVACYMNGVDPDEAVVDVKKLKAQEYALGNALW